MPWISIHIPCSLPSTSKSSTPRFQFRFNFRSQIPNSIASFESLPNTCPCLRKYQILILNLSLDISLTPPCVPRPNIKVKSNSKLLFPPNQFSQQKFKIPPSTFVGRIPSLGPFPLSARFPLPFPRAPHVSRSGERDPSLSLCSLSLSDLLAAAIRFSPPPVVSRALPSRGRPKGRRRHSLWSSPAPMTILSPLHSTPPTAVTMGPPASPRLPCPRLPACVQGRKPERARLSHALSLLPPLAQNGKELSSFPSPFSFSPDHSRRHHLPPLRPLTLEPAPAP